MKKKNRVGDVTLPDFKTYFNVTVSKIVGYGHKDRHMGQCNRIESPEINPHIYGEMNFDTGAKVSQWENWIKSLGKLDSHI